jgi:DNA transposition AAA+ family ATPase
MNVQQKLQTYLKDNSLSQAAMARAMGCSASKINLFLANKYNGDVKSFESEISQFLALAEEKKQNAGYKGQFIMTSTAKTLLEMIRNAHVHNHIAVIIGEPGLGKTVTLEEYARQYSHVIFVKKTVGRNANALLELICKQLNIPARSSVARMIDDIIDKISHSGRLIIVDEAENLPLKALEALRTIHDQAKVGMIMAGTQRLYINLKGSHGELAQLYSRVWQHENLGYTLPENDLIEIIETATTEPDVVKAFLIACCGNGRMLEKLLDQTQRISELNATPITAQIVRDCEKMLLK